jgi:hypothetical protein
MKTACVATFAGLIVFGWTPDVHAQRPCDLLTTAEVQQVFPGSKPGRADRALEKQGIFRCQWETPMGSLLLITGDEVTEPPKEEAKTWTLGLVDPLRSDAERRVRYEVLTGVGDEAIAVVERRDQEKGFIQNAAFLVVRRGKRQVSVMSTGLASRERGEALKVLAELGKAIAKKLS